MKSRIDVISTPEAPAAIGPYAQARRFGSMIYTSGQIPLRADGSFVDGDITAQTRQVLANLARVLEAAGSDLGHVIKTTVFLQDLGDFQAMNEVYAQAFGDNRPSRSTVQVAALPKGSAVEIEVIAVVREAS